MFLVVAARITDLYFESMMTFLWLQSCAVVANMRNTSLALMCSTFHLMIMMMMMLVWELLK